MYSSIPPNPLPDPLIDLSPVFILGFSLPRDGIITSINAILTYPSTLNSPLTDDVIIELSLWVNIPSAVPSIGNDNFTEDTNTMISFIPLNGSTPPKTVIHSGGTFSIPYPAGTRILLGVKARSGSSQQVSDGLLINAGLGIT